MTTTVIPAALRSAVRAAILAPSVHNTQPWHFVITDDGVELRADRTRRLSVVDPTGRQMTLSLGCALLNMRVQLAADGVPVLVRRYPDGTTGDCVARVSVGDSAPPVDPSLAALGSVLDLRQSNRRQFDDDVVPVEVVELLQTVAAAEGAHLQSIALEEDRLTLASLSQAADTLQITDPRYRAELRQWTTNDPDRLDGVRAAVVPHVDGSARDDMPVRDFDTQGAGWLPAGTSSNPRQTLLVLGTEADGSIPWLRAGEALERVWLELTRAGFVASLFTQVIELPALRVQLRDELRLTMQPHIVIRAGRAPWTAPSLRRHFNDVTDDRTSG